MGCSLPILSPLDILLLAWAPLNKVGGSVTGSNVGCVDWGASPGEVWAKERAKGAMAESADAVRRKRGTPERQKIVWNPKDEALFSVSCAVYI